MSGGAIYFVIEGVITSEPSGFFRSSLSLMEKHNTAAQEPHWRRARREEEGEGELSFEEY